MKALFVLIVGFIIGLAIIRLYKKEHSAQWAGRFAMAVMLFFTALGHFLYPEGMSAMIPGFIPFKQFTVIFTGILEIVFAIALLVFSNKKSIGLSIITFFLLVLPANIYAAMEGINYQTGALDGPDLSYLWFRIPLQLFFIAWVYFSCISIRSFLKNHNLKISNS